MVVYALVLAIIFLRLRLAELKRAAFNRPGLPYRPMYDQARRS